MIVFLLFISNDITFQFCYYVISNLSIYNNNAWKNPSFIYDSISGVAGGGGIGQLPIAPKVIAHGFFEMVTIAQCRKISMNMHVRRL